MPKLTDRCKPQPLFGSRLSTMLDSEPTAGRSRGLPRPQCGKACLRASMATHAGGFGLRGSEA